MSQLFAKMFGPPQIRFDGRPVVFSYRKAEALIYYLLLCPKASRARLAGLLWDDINSAAALKNLRHAVFTVRKSVGADIFESADRSHLSLSPALEISCDALTFLQTGDLSICRGELLEGFHLQRAGAYEEWLTQERERLRAHYLKTLLAAFKDAFSKGDAAAAERLGQQYIQADPLEESVYALLMTLYGREKKFRKAISVYHALCERLSSELSISPLKETTSLYYRIVNEWNASTWRLEEQTSRLLIGKDAVLRRLLLICSGSFTEQRIPCALIKGDSGVGKTYLLDHIFKHYDFSDWLICRAFCYFSETSAALSPWNSIILSLMSEVVQRHIHIPKNYLSMAAKLFPCLLLSAGQETAASDWTFPLQQNFHAARESTLLIISMIASHLPILLIFEDIHWMDRESVDFLSVLLRRIRNQNITVICTCRTDPPEHIREFEKRALQDNILEQHTLSQFSAKETATFVHYYLGGKASPELISQMFRSTGGNALLLSQLVRLLQENPDRQALSENLAQIVSTRIAQLPPEERRLLDLIAVFPDRTPFDFLSSVLSTDAMDLTFLCGRLKRRLLIFESADADNRPCYAPAHDQIRDTVLSQISGAEKSVFHLQAAAYLEAHAAYPDIALYDRLAWHYGTGGDRLKAFRYRVLSLNSYTSMFYAVFPLLTSDSAARNPMNTVDRFHTLEKELSHIRRAYSAERIRTELKDLSLDDLEMLLTHAESCYFIYVGGYEEGLASLRRLVTLCERNHHTPLLIHAHLQYIFYGIQIWDTSIMDAHIRAGLGLLSGERPSEEYGTYLRMQGLYRAMCGNYAEARETLYRSIEAFRRLDSSADDARYAISIAGAYNYIAETFRMEERLTQAFEAYEQALLFNRSRGYYPGVAVFYTNYGVAAFQKGDLPRARQLLDNAMKTYRAAHEYSGRPIALSYQAWFLAGEGDYAQAADYLQEALYISDMLQNPWWQGITLYLCFKIRRELKRRHIDAPQALASLYPASEAAHCALCLKYLRKLSPMPETREMEAAMPQN